MLSSTVSFSCGIVYSRGNRTPGSEKNQTSVYLIKRNIKRHFCRLCVEKEAAPPTAAAAAAVEKKKEEKMPKGIYHQTENEKEN